VPATLVAVQAAHRRLGRNVVFLTVLGWVASPGNIATMLEKLDGVTYNEKSTLVFDLFSNTSYHFEQFNGSLSLPYK
jgi:hypothetical protein